MRSNFRVVALVLLSILLSVSLSACGGGGGGGGQTTTTTTQTISGVAAAGLPIVGYVYLKDSAAHTLGPNPIDSEGKFSFNVTGLTASFYLRAQGSVAGTSYDLYSATTSAGTANINPLTNLAVAAAAGVSDPSSVYSNPAQHPITQQNLNQAFTDIQNMLKPLLDAYNANVNPITGTYTANHTGLDAVFDVVEININTTTGSVTVMNDVTDTTIASATTTTLSTPTDPLTQTEVPSTKIVTDLQAIQKMFNQLVTVINKGAKLTTADLEPFYATNYGIDEGLNRTQKINNELSDVQGWKKTITSVNITIEEAMGADYKVKGVFYLSDASFGFWENGIIVTNEGGSWKRKGNGYKSDVDFDVLRTRRWIKVDSTVQTESGFDFGINDEGNYGLQSAKITGPGLPTAGITLSKPANEPVSLYLDTQYQNTTIPTDRWSFYVMSDPTISSIPDNAIYTIEIYGATGNLIETRTVKIQKRPFMRSELTDGHFPTFGGINSHSISAANIGGTLTFTYAIPTAFLTAGGLGAMLNYWDDSGNSARYEVDLLLNQSSGSITSGMPSWTPKAGHFKIEAEDVFQREMSISWMFQ